MRSDDATEGAVRLAHVLRDGLVEVLERPFADLLVSRALLAAGHDALDLGAGVGCLAARISPAVGEGGSVTAREADPVLVEVGRDSVPQVAWSVGEPEALPFEAGSFDAVLSCHGLDDRDDPVAALDEARRVLRLGARVSLVLWCGLERNPLFAAVASAVEKVATDGDLRRELAAYRARFERSRPERWREELERAGFVMVTVEEQRLDLALPDLDLFVPLYLRAAGLGRVLRDSDSIDRQGVVAEITGAIRTAQDDEGRLPVRSLLAFGRAWRA